LVEDHQGYLAFTIPRHPSFKQVMELTAGPLLVANPRFSGQEYGLASSAAQLDNRVALAIDDGLAFSPSPTTVVRINGNHCSVEYQGKLSAEEVVTQSQFRILIVCTGNTCRSPMAEQLLKRKLKDRFPEHFANSQLLPVDVVSAGVSAYPGGPASDGAVAAMSTYGFDLSQHESQPTTDELVEKADLILTMTSNHRMNLLSRWPHLGRKTFGLAMDHDVSDPYGGPVEVYLACARKIDQYLEAWLDRLDVGTLPIWTIEGRKLCG
jgi:protein-tyrosine phosphatase